MQNRKLDRLRLAPLFQLFPLIPAQKCKPGRSLQRKGFHTLARVTTIAWDNRVNRVAQFPIRPRCTMHDALHRIESQVVDVIQRVYMCVCVCVCPCDAEGIAALAGV
jgi:hypothetical protein